MSTPTKRDADHLDEQQQHTPSKKQKASAAVDPAAEELPPPTLEVRKFENNTFYKHRKTCFWKEMKLLNDECMPAFQSLKDNLDISPHNFQVFAGYYIARRQQFLDKYSTNPGFVIVCGSNDMVQLGVRSGKDERGEKLTEVPPKLIHFFNDKGIVQISSSGGANAAVSVDGNVYTWGCTDDGILGRANPVELDGELSIPDKVTGFVSSEGVKEDGKIVMVTAGEACFYYLSADGNVYMNGMVRDTDNTKFGCIKQVLKPVKKPLHIVTEQPVIRVYSSCSTNVGVLLLKDGSLRTFGFGNAGELARSHDMCDPSIVKKPDGATTKTYDVSPKLYKNENGDVEKVGIELVRDKYLTPQPPRWQGPIPYPKKVVMSVAVGSKHLLVVARDPGNPHTFMYASGLNKNGQLGLGDGESRHELCKATDPRLRDIKQVAAGNYHSFALCMSGKYLYAFGENTDGRLGIGYQASEKAYFNPNPELVTFNSHDPVLLSSISCGDDHTLAISLEGDVYAWGYNESGQTAIPQNKSIVAQTVYRPKKVDYSSAFGQVDTSPLQALQVSGGSVHSVFLVGLPEAPYTENISGSHESPRSTIISVARLEEQEEED